jgi:Nuclease-related domain
MHDLAVPGSRANIDHLVIGPGGVFVIGSDRAPPWQAAG